MGRRLRRLAVSRASAACGAERGADARSKRRRNIAGKTITIVWEAGLQSLDPLNFSGPKWEELTGMQGQGGRSADRRDVHQDHAGVPRRHRRLRRAQRDPGLDARPGAGRRAGAARPLCRQVRLPRRAAEDRADLSRQPDDGRTARSTASPTTATSSSSTTARTSSATRRPEEGVQGQVQATTSRRPRPGSEFDEIGQLPDREAEERRHLRRRLLPRAALHACSCSRSASASKAASSSTPTR